MSHILDALQKVQNEKTARLKQSTMTAGVLLESPVRSQNKKRLYLFATAVVICLCVTAIFVWFTLTPSKTDSKNATEQASTAAIISAISSTPDQTVSPLQKPLQSVPQSVQKKTEGFQSTQHRVAQTTHNKNAGTAKSSAEPVFSTAPEGIKLTGIAWQDNRQTRRAVINDTLVGEGSVVAGAKVLEIKPDMVRFEKSGSIYESFYRVDAV